MFGAARGPSKCYRLRMKLLHIAMSLGLCIGALAHPSTARADAPHMPAAKPALMFSGKFDSLGSVRRGSTFSLKVQVGNGLVYELPTLKVTVAGEGVKIRSAATKVFKNVEGNGGTVTLIIKGKLLDTRGVVHLVAATGVIDEDVGPFELKQDVAVGTAP